MRGVFPSNKVIILSSFLTGKKSQYSRITPCHMILPKVTSSEFREKKMKDSELRTYTNVLIHNTPHPTLPLKARVGVM
jgi:hypothetical protein